MVGKSDEIWQINHVRKFDEQNFDELSYIFVRAAYYCKIIMWSRELRNVAVLGFHAYKNEGSQLLLKLATYDF